LRSLRIATAPRLASLRAVAVGPEPDSRRAVREPGLAFNDAIARQDLVALAGLMTADHTFIDVDENVAVGREVMLKAWKAFFASYPDYRNCWSGVTVNGATLIATGRSICATEPDLDGPAIWTATIRAERVAEWRIYADTPEKRAERGLDPA
jgi:ketosteroid isomerase-like protein